MASNTKDSNADLYSKELLETWTSRNKLIKAESFLLDKYMTDTSKNVVEGGTGGGRISFHIEERGFTNLCAFDYVPEMIDFAKKAGEEKGSAIKFEVGDAVSLNNYVSDSFEYLVYLQQVLCFIPERDRFSEALKESYRIAKKDGIIIYSFLDFETRRYNALLSLFVGSLRKIRREAPQKQHLPWVKMNSKFNWKLLGRNQAITYWVKKSEIVTELEKIGFTVLEAKNANQLGNDSTARKGMLYVVCKK